MNDLTTVLGSPTTTCVLEVIYEVIISEIRKSSEGKYNQWLASSIDIYDKYSRIHNVELGKLSIQNKLISFKKPPLDYDDTLVCYVSKKTDLDILSLVFQIEGPDDPFLHLNSLGLLINYGIDVVKKSIINELIRTFDGILEDKWIIVPKNVDVVVNFNIHTKPLQITITMEICNEEAFRPGGERYLEIQRITQIGKK